MEQYIFDTDIKDLKFCVTKNGKQTKVYFLNIKTGKYKTIKI